MAATMVTVLGTFEKADGSAESGTVKFRLTKALFDRSGNQIATRSWVEETLDGSGGFSTPLYATNDPTTDPRDANYDMVLTRGDGSTETWRFPVPYDAPSGAFNVADITVASGDPGYAYVSQSQLNALSNSLSTSGIARKVFSVSDYGASGDGSDQTTAIQQAIAAALAVNGVCWFPPGTYVYSALMGQITDTMSIEGAGSDLVVLKPAAAYTGWAFDVYNCWRNGEEDFTDTTVSMSAFKAGVKLKGFSIFADRATVAYGIKFTGINDYPHMDDVHLNYLRIGLSLGGQTTADCVREGIFQRLNVFGCGNAATSEPSILIDTGTASGDGTNQLTFRDLKVGYPLGETMRIKNSNAAAGGSEITRRISIDGFMNHGTSQATVDPACDLMVIEGKVHFVNVMNMRTNGSHDVGGTKYACVRLKADGLSVQPKIIDFTGVNLTSCSGHGFYIEKAQAVRIEGISDPNSISGNEVFVAASSIDTLWLDLIALVTSTRTVSIDASVVDKVSGTWAANTHTFQDLAVLDDATFSKPLLLTGQSAVPSTPAATSFALYSKLVAAISELHMVGVGGAEQRVGRAPGPFRFEMLPSSSSSVAFPDLNGTAIGTPAGATDADQSYIETFTTAAVLSDDVGAYGNLTVFQKGSTTTGGIRFEAIIKLPDASYNSSGATTGSRIFAGWANQTHATISAADDPAGFRLMFQRHHVNGGKTQTNWFVSSKDNVTENLIDTTLPFIIGKWYRMVLHLPFLSGSGRYYWHLWNLTDSTEASGSSTTNPPAGGNRPMIGLRTIDATARAIAIGRMVCEAEK